MGISGTPTTGRRNLKRQFFMTLLAAVAVYGFVWVATAQTGGKTPPKPEAVEAVFPEGNNLELRQTTIYADLAPGYTGDLLLDGDPVLESDVQRVEALNTVTLRPESGSELTALQPGRHCATVVYRRIGSPQADSASYTWCFRLH